MKMAGKNQPEFSCFALLQRYVCRALGSSDTGAAMFNLLVSYSELTQTMTNHKWGDFNILEAIAVVNTKGEVYHLGENDHVAAVGSDDWGLSFLEFLPSLPDLLEEFLLTRRKASFKRSSAPSWEEFDEIVHAHFDELLDFVATICWFSATLGHVITL